MARGRRGWGRESLTRGLERTTGGDGTAAAAQQEEQLIFFPPWTLEGTRRVDDSKGPEKREGEVFSHHAIGRPGLRLVFGQWGAPRDDDDEGDAATGASWKGGADHTNCCGPVRARGGAPTRPRLIAPSPSGLGHWQSSSGTSRFVRHEREAVLGTPSVPRRRLV